MLWHVSEWHGTNLHPAYPNTAAMQNRPISTPRQPAKLPQQPELEQHWSRLHMLHDMLHVQSPDLHTLGTLHALLSEA